MKFKEYYEYICAGQQVRQNLIALRDELQEGKTLRAFAYLLGGDFSKLCELLDDGDPKIRKNAALILGKMESEDLLPILFAAYRREQTLFVRADYLKAISQMDYYPILEELQRRLQVLREMDAEPAERKHIAEELRVLQSMVLRYQEKKAHKFTGQQSSADVILVTNRSLREVTARQIKNGRITMLAGGVRIQGADLSEIRKIRTYRELLFPVSAGVFSLIQMQQTGELPILVDSVLMLAKRLHEGDGAYLFRIELKNASKPDIKGVLLRRISDAIEKASGGQLINSVSDYELELRLLERKDGMIVPMVKFFTIPDRRFAYRKEYVASSISPVNAALVAELARPYLKEGAQILDPFCGVGTMLIERDRAVKAGIMYGIDVFGEAIEKARTNTERAGCHVYYINKNFFEFEHGYQFDEVITDLPQVTTNHPKQEVRCLYHDFFAKISQYLNPEAVLILYSTEPEFVIEALREQREYRIVERYTINEKNRTEVFVVRR